MKTKDSDKAVKSYEKEFEKMGIKKEQYPRYEGYESFAYSFTQVTAFQKPGKITSTANTNA